MSEGAVHLLQLLASGVVTGGIYALVAMGFVVVYKATRVINFATGEFMMLGAFVAWTVMTALEAPFAAALLAALLFAALLGTATERLVLRPLLGQRSISVIMVTIGMAAIFKGLAQIAWSGDYRSYPAIFPRAPVELGPIILPSRQFYPFLIALGAIAAAEAPVRIEGVGTDSIQGDIRFVEAAEAMGAQVRAEPNALEVRRGAWPLRAIDMDCNAIPDAAMTLAVMAAPLGP